MISYDEAIQIIQEYGLKLELPIETINLADVPGRICAQHIKSKLTVQPFDNSAMDGYALKSSEIATASNDNPLEIFVSGRVSAGDLREVQKLSSGQCMEIMTGAPIPKGADTVVPVENAVPSHTGVIFKSASKVGNNIRFAGEDFQPGMSVLESGVLLKPHHVLVLSTIGVNKVAVRSKPKVAFIPTGKELVDDLDKDLAFGQIYNSNGPYLQASLSALGASVEAYKTIADNENDFITSLKRAMGDDIDLVITTGAVSAGVHDFVRGVLEEIGAEILFHKVKIKPGKPMLFARLPNGKLFFGLPGNPAASVVGVRFFVYPLLRTILGQSMEVPKTAVLLNDLTKSKEDFRFFLKAKMVPSGCGIRRVKVLVGQQSFMVRSFLDCNTWVVAPEGCSSLESGDSVEVYSLLA